MRIIRPSSEDEMVLAFLRAEAAALGEMGYTRALIDNPDLESASENQARAQCLSALRGYKLNAFLFRGFPDNVSWNRVFLSIEELASAKFIKQDV